MSKNHFVKKEIIEKMTSLFDYDMKHGVPVPETIKIESIENAKIEIIKDSINKKVIYLEDFLEKLLESEEGKILLIKTIQKI
ncbi:hypothetical protein [Cetobacterium somerae]